MANLTDELALVLLFLELRAVLDEYNCRERLYKLGELAYLGRPDPAV